MMTYSEFETRLFLALVDASDATERGQCEAFEVAKTVWSQAPDQWVRDAVMIYEQKGYTGLISRPVEGGISLTVSGNGRSAADNLRAQIAEATKIRNKIGFHLD